MQNLEGISSHDLIAELQKRYPSDTKSPLKKWAALNIQRAKVYIEEDEKKKSHQFGTIRFEK